MKMKRRHFLQTTATGSLAMGLSAFRWLAAPTPTPYQYALAHPGLLTLFDDAHQVQTLGLEYRDRFQDENDARVLQAHVSDRIEFTEDQDMLQSRIEQQVRSDFAQGQTVQLQGWILSITEARQCALYSFL